MKKLSNNGVWGAMEQKKQLRNSIGHEKLRMACPAVFSDPSPLR